MEHIGETTLLQAVYKGGAMGTLSIGQLLPKVQNPALYSDMQTQLSEYQKVMKQAAQQLKELSVCPKELSDSEKMMLTASLYAKTMMNKETSHIAEMLIQGSNMAVITLTKVLNSYPVPEAHEQTNPPQHMETRQKAKDLAMNMIQAEKDNINRLKNYLC